MMFMGTEITEADLTNNVWNKYLFVSEVIGKRLIHPWKLVKYIKRSLKWSWQRITRGFSDGDIWWMHTYLQMLLPDMLQYLKDHRMAQNSAIDFISKVECLLINDDRKPYKAAYCKICGKVGYVKLCGAGYEVYCF